MSKINDKSQFSKNFDDWIILKSNIHKKNQKTRFFNERQIWLCFR